MKEIIVILIFASMCAVTRGQGIHYVYDPAGRLIEAHYDTRKIMYLYDVSGNLLAKRLQAFVDSDSDGMDDGWEQSYFQNLAQTASGDADEDGFSNLSEFLAGTIPTDSNSLLRLTAHKDAVGIRIEWPSVTGKEYQLQYKDAVSDAQWIDHPSGSVTAPGSTTVFTDATGNPKRFYRVILGP